ncbi:MAG: hypothetical protein AAGD14_06015, partial [Planctomycetota bacterium]
PSASSKKDARASSRVRLVLVLVLLAAAGGVAFLFLEGDGRGERTREERGEGAETKPGDDGRPAPQDPVLPSFDLADPAAFVAQCRAAGPPAISALLAKLRGKENRTLAPRWQFKDGKLIGYPTERAVYLQALAAIPGSEATFALEQSLRTARSVEESYLVARALQERDVGGWSRTLLERARAGNAANQRLRMEIATFAAKADAGGTAATIVEAAPRGESKDDARILAAASKALPLDLATETTTRVLDDAEITYRAKDALLRALLKRPEPEVMLRVEEELGRRELDDRMRRMMALEACNHPGFSQDVIEYGLAVSKKDMGKADVIRRRFDARERAAERLIGSALRVDPRTTSDRSAQAAMRILAAHRARLEKQTGR